MLNMQPGAAASGLERVFALRVVLRVGSLNLRPKPAPLDATLTKNTGRGLKNSSRELLRPFAGRVKNCEDAHLVPFYPVCNNERRA